MKQPDSKRSSPSSNLVSSSKTSTHSFEDSIRKAISQAFRDVEKQLKQSKTISPSLKVQNQAPSSTVSELKDAEPDSVAQSDLAALVQEDQTEIPTITIQKDDQPIKDDLILFKQDVIEEEAPMESKSDSGVEHLFVTDSNGFQRTFLGTFLISPFVWNKTRAVELSRHQLGMEHVVFEPGGELWNHRNNPLVIEKKSAATTIVFGDLLPSEAKGMHVSAQQEFHYETNWRMLPTISWIQQTRKRSKWPPDHQDIVNSAKHIGLAKFCELLISDWGGRLQFYLWKTGAYSSILIILGECSARSRTSWGNKELEADQNALLLDHVKKQPDSKRSSPSSNLVSSSKTSTHSFEDSIRKAISQAFRDVEKQLKQSKTISPSLKVQNQAPSSTVSELKDAEPDSVAQSDLAALVQEDQTEIPTITIQKDDQPIKDDLILFKQDVIEEEAPMESKSDSGVEHLFVTDSNGFQRTFLGTFLISPFVWNKTRAVELSRHQLGMEHVVFEPGGELWNHRNNPLVIEKKSAATTIVFGDLLPSEAKGIHVSAQQEFQYETNWRMLPTISWIQQTRKRSKWPPDHQDIVNSAKHIGLAKFCELLISDWGGRLQFYLWKTGAYSSILIILGECSARSRTSWGNKGLEADQNALLLDHVKGEWYEQEVRTIDHTANHLAHTSGLSNVEEVQSLGVFILAMRTVGSYRKQGNIP
ncbi:hypothetical protein HID58_092183 [Brassica napus]|uniref:Uncharacterized protein n=1 Tax=Brassica napus TaxID=3708 RepID=A0ABQ7WXB4_BRANA|nr:hypothetical protein HID58_092183 [Brassica napus]